ncbi:MAG: sulfatase-like hydrolase/transferase [Pontiellaceae bacterium]|nr:sulfatase-like hydrolase/transferase [Pontiellaceae bacterium]MBN2785429.1 sulfatase-like hydrolase/transferase [Pontiellaceae bacterium]
MRQVKWNRRFKSAAMAGVLGFCGVVNAAMIYTVNGSGVIRSFSGAASGINPIEDNTFSGGTPVTTIASYGTYLGFTQAPDGMVYGVNASGGVDRWNTLASWLSGDAPVAESSGVYGAGGIHGCSYDGFTGGYYVVYEGGDLEGDIGKYATLSDFINNQNASVSPASYGGNIHNFYYPDSDSSAGSRYYQASAAGDLEGWETLASYISSSANRTDLSPDGGFAGVGSAFAVVEGTVLLLPPESLDAFPTNGHVRLEWPEGTGAETYNIYRSTIRGGYGTPFQTGVSGSFFEDTSVSAYDHYYYAVSSVAGGIESTLSEDAFVVVPGDYDAHGLNILFIFIDDMGWGDMSCYGNPVTTKDGGVVTPHLDSLASQGIRFTEGYTGAPICSPSRVCVMTGIESQRYAIYSFLNDKSANDNRNMNDWLDPYTVAAPRLFRDAGYVTGQFGKWHMGGGRDVNHAPFPQAYGFQESLVAFEGMGDRVLYNGDGLSSANADVEGNITWAEWYEGADIHTDAAIDFISRAVQSNKNFYVHVPYNDVHSPYNTDPGKEDDFDHITDNTTAQLFLSEMHELDKEIGRLVQAVDDLGVGTNTLIVIVGDNGAPNDTINGILRRNGGLSGGKGNLWEGGIREPFIVRCPGLVPEGTVNTTTAVSTLDLLPTYASFAGIELPNAPFAGEDMSDVFQGSSRTRRRPQFWEYGTVSGLGSASPMLAMRSGNYKLLVNPDGSELKLFDLSVDKEETTNLSGEASLQDRVADMRAQVMAWYNETVLGNGIDTVTITNQTVETGVIFYDDFSVTGGSAPSSGFSENAGVNYEFASRVGGSAASDLWGYRYGDGTRPATDFSVGGNRMAVIPRNANGRFELSPDGAGAFNFGNYLAGNVYEVSVDMDVDVVGSQYAQRMSLSLADVSNLVIGDVDLGLQVGTDGAGGLGVFLRMDAGSQSGTGDINRMLVSGLPVGTPVALRMVISDFNDNTSDYSSTYEIFVNGSSVASGAFRFNNSNSARYLIFDTAAHEGTVYYDNVSVELTQVNNSSITTVGQPVGQLAQIEPTPRVYWNVQPNMVFEPQCSTNLALPWIPSGSVTNEHGTIRWMEFGAAAGSNQAFFKL